MPVRIQLRRARGWRKPARAVVVSRPSRWGNPIRITPAPAGRGALEYRVHRGAETGDGPAYTSVRTARAFATRFFEWDLRNGRLDYPPLTVIQAELAGKDLCCWCPLDGPCHGDVLLQIANEEQE